MVDLGYVPGDHAQAIMGLESALYGKDDIIAFRHPEFPDILAFHPIQAVETDTNGKLYYITNGPNNEHTEKVYP